MNNQSIALLDTVIITVDLLEQQVLAGDLGTIVDCLLYTSRCV